MLECLVIQQLMCTYYMSHVVCCIASVTRFSEEDGQQHESRRCTFIALMSGSEQRRSLRLLTLRVRDSGSHACISRPVCHDFIVTLGLLA